jgi:hypothetical protein
MIRAAAMPAENDPNIKTMSGVVTSHRIWKATFASS